MICTPAMHIVAVIDSDVAAVAAGWAHDDTRSRVPPHHHHDDCRRYLPFTSPSRSHTSSGSADCHLSCHESTVRVLDVADCGHGGFSRRPRRSTTADSQSNDSERLRPRYGRCRPAPPTCSHRFCSHASLVKRLQLPAPLVWARVRSTLRGAHHGRE